MSKTTSGTLRLVLDSRIEYIDIVHSMTEGLARLSGQDKDRGFQTGLAVREALINAIRHGNQEDPKKKVIIEFLVETGRLTIRIQDQGTGFDFTAEPNPLDPENIYRTNGRGIFLMRSFADQVEFGRTPEGGTEVRIIQKISKGNPHRKNPIVSKEPEGESEGSEGGEWMKASVRQIGAVTILDLAGKITIGAGDLVLRDRVNSLLDQGSRMILINLEMVSYMDSAGIGELVACRKKTMDLGGSVKLLNPSGKVSDLLHLTKLEEIFEIHRDEERALGTFH